MPLSTKSPLTEWNDRRLFGDVATVRRFCPPLESNAVHLWLVDLNRQEADATTLETALSADECAAGQSFRYQHLRRRYLLAHGVLRFVLGAYLEIAPSAVAFTYSPNGKPRLDKQYRSGLYFNLSRSEDLAAIAVTAIDEVGVDVERLRPVPDRLSLARDYFSASEHEEITVAAPDRADALFLECWTRKEAVVKATGEGLSRPLHSLSVGFSNNNESHNRAEESLAGWSILSFRPRTEYVGAAAVVARSVTWEILPPRQAP
jgi:4'-phosphopantetheinyl transferase